MVINRQLIAGCFGHVGFCQLHSMQLTKAYMCETSCNQLLVTLLRMCSYICICSRSCSHSHFHVVFKDVDLRVETIRKGSHLKQQISDAEVCGALNVHPVIVM